MNKVEDMGELELLELRMKESLEGRVKSKNGFLARLFELIIIKWQKEGEIKC